MQHFVTYDVFLDQKKVKTQQQQNKKNKHNKKCL